MLISIVSLFAAAAPKAVVVGAGVGGLYTAAKLQKAGVDVTLVEQNSRGCAGGRLGCETVVAQNGRKYRFETGPSLLLLPSIYREALSEVGIAPDEYLQLERVRPSYSVHFSDGGPTPLQIGGDAACERALERDLEAVEAGAYASALTPSLPNLSSYERLSHLASRREPSSASSRTPRRPRLPTTRTAVR